jgi:hypothetical protein
MTVLTFPSSPIIGQQYNAPNEIQYVFDGVKWIVETVASTSAAVTNAVQDKVAPMFVNGDNTGITFSYNAATNVMSADVTAEGDRLVNGAQTLTLESNGNITAPAFTIPNTAGTSGQVLKWPGSGTTLAWGSDSNTTNKLVNGLNEAVLNSDGTTTFPTGGQIANYPGGVGASDNSWFVTPGGSGNGGVSSQDGQQYIQINNNLFVEIGTSYGTANESLWRFGRDGALTSPGGGFTKTTTNTLATTVLTQIVWTATQTYISGAKLTIQVEANETGGTGNWETQVCEAVIAVRGYNQASVPVMSVYGVTHTSVAPLMTFTVDRNPVSNLVEIVGTRTATATTTGNASLRIYSVETGTMD